MTQAATALAAAGSGGALLLALIAITAAAAGLWTRLRLWQRMLLGAVGFGLAALLVRSVLVG
jgi:hypothetical protein